MNLFGNGKCGTALIPCVGEVESEKNKDEMRTADWNLARTLEDQTLGDYSTAELIDLVRQKPEMWQEFLRIIKIAYLMGKGTL